MRTNQQTGQQEGSTTNVSRQQNKKLQKQALRGQGALPPTADKQSRIQSLSSIATRLEQLQTKYSVPLFWSLGSSTIERYHGSVVMTIWSGAQHIAEATFTDPMQAVNVAFQSAEDWLQRNQSQRKTA
jgi:hypothetical protein